ncbi:hypothetical protein ACFE04_000491 [Oxalis oulophora]
MERDGDKYSYLFRAFIIECVVIIVVVSKPDLSQRRNGGIDAASISDSDSDSDDDDQFNNSPYCLTSVRGLGDHVLRGSGDSAVLIGKGCKHKEVVVRSVRSADVVDLGCVEKELESLKRKSMWCRNVCGFYGVVRREDELCIVMEKCNGYVRSNVKVRNKSYFICRKLSSHITRLLLKIVKAMVVMKMIVMASISDDCQELEPGETQYLFLRLWYFDVYENSVHQAFRFGHFDYLTLFTGLFTFVPTSFALFLP